VRRAQQVGLPLARDLVVDLRMHGFSSTSCHFDQEPSFGAAWVRGHHPGPISSVELATMGGAAPLTKRAETELLASGARPRRIALSGVDSLTPSERRVAQMAAEGLMHRVRAS
jgi:hypothetical protein